MRDKRTFAFALVILAFLSLASPRCRAQAALLMEQPYGFFGTVNPTGHTAVYFERICAETPVKLRRCQPGEMGAVVSRYQGLAGYDWIAIPLVPYLYSVENASEVPERVDRDIVHQMRDLYHETHLLSLGEDVPRGNFLHGGWTELVGVAYERRIYAYRFQTTEKQDDAFIARMNGTGNRSHFQLLFNNCADFARVTLNFYFPRTFRRNVFPDAGMTTPKQIAYKLTRYARKHPETQLTVFEISQIPGYRRMSRSNKSITESLVTTGYAIPLVAVNPYLAGGLFVDYLVRGRYHLIPKHHEVLGPDKLAALTSDDALAQNPESPELQTATAGESEFADTPAEESTSPGMKEMVSTHE
ncbi:MAG: hypothetical protein KGM96_12240 [Acidobacteriota bacterium]|nr:hypothetical protein [Acidobacteriota bacterium]